MKTIPILFSTEMVQALLAVTKTQTRRIVNLKGEPDFHCMNIDDNGVVRTGWFPDHLSENKKLSCPYGSPGDILWVRESWNTVDTFPEPDVFGLYLYKANGDTGKFKPSKFMPKEACRLFLKVKAVRVERLLDISEADAVAEGILKDIILPGPNFTEIKLYRDYTGKTAGCTDARSSYMTLWQKINGTESWEVNPWVWVVEFEKCDKPDSF